MRRIFVSSALLRSLLVIFSLTIADRAIVAQCPAGVPFATPIATVTGNLGSNGMFDAPNFGVPPTTQAGLGDAFFYNSTSFCVTVSGDYVFNSMLQSSDAALFLYLGSFNPSNSLSNILFGSTSFDVSFDPSLGPNPGLPIELALMASTSYTLVTSSFFDNAPESYITTIACPGGTCAEGQIVTLTSTVPEPGTVALVAMGLVSTALISRRRTRLV